jgi:glycosyltransferase involved in cell wall biosynthesis
VLESERSAGQARADELQNALLRSESALAEKTARLEAETTRLTAAVAAERSAGQVRVGELQNALLRSETALVEKTAQFEAETTRLTAAIAVERSAGRARADELQNALLRSETALVEKTAQLEAETTRLTAAIATERSAGRARADELQKALLRSETALIEAERIAEAYRGGDDPSIRSLARVVHPIAQFGRKIKGLAAPRYILPGRRRKLRKKLRLKREAELISASGLFNPEWYLQAYPDVAEAGEDPLIHYLQYGVAERRNPNSLFDTDWYLRQYPDVAESGQNPLVHFVMYGAAERRDPGPGFSTEWYLSQNPDVAEAGVDAFWHFLVYGRGEGRQPAPVSWGYEQWQAKFDYQSGEDKESYFKILAEMPLHPCISILMPVYNPKPNDLQAAIQSVANQLDPNWELCIADDASTDENVKSILDAAAKLDRRIKIVYRESNGHISEATNSAFALASGEYVGLLDHDDILREHALAEVVIAINGHPDVELLYSDEDKIDECGDRYDAFFKPDFSLDLFYSMNYLNHFTVHRAENLKKVKGWRKGFEGSQDYDINLRVIENIDRRKIVHIPKILYHWRAAAGSTARAGSEKGYAFTAGLRALEGHVARLNLPAKVEEIEGLPFYRFRWQAPRPEPMVSLIIPTRDMVDILRKCISSILEKTQYTNYEILLVDNNSQNAETFEYFNELSTNPRVRILAYPKPFNYSAINNFAAREAKGKILGLINNDIEVITSEWLEEMVAHALRSEMGCIGAKLLYPNDTIQHAGVMLGIGGVANHAHLGCSRNSPGYFGRLCVCQNVSAVTAACMVLRTDVFWEVGGLDEDNLAVAFNDVDLCLKVREAGYSNLFTPFALLYHHESLSRGQEDTPEKKRCFAGEVTVMKERWGDKLLKDPFYSPNLTLDRTDFSFRFD